MKLSISAYLSLILLVFHTAVFAHHNEKFPDLPNAESIAFYDASMDVLRRSMCRKEFRKYILKKRSPKAFAYTVDPRGAHSKCSASYNKKESEKYALHDCNWKRNKSKSTKKNAPECKLFAINNKLLVSMADYDLKPPEADLIFAIQFKSSSTIKKMIENGADVNQTDRYEDTPLTRAVMVERFDVVEYLLEKGADIKHKDKRGFDALHGAALNDDLKLFKFLLSKGADVNTTAKRDQRKPIHYVAVDGYGEILRYLAAEGVDISEPDQLGMTPLHHAVKSRNLNSIKALLENGANVHAKTKKGETALDLTKKHRKPKIRDYLISKGADK